MIPNHEGPDEPVMPRDTEDWEMCGRCQAYFPETKYCAECDANLCPTCQEEDTHVEPGEWRGPDTTAEGAGER